jgi:hypothetical protein
MVKYPVPEPVSAKPKFGEPIVLGPYVNVGVALTKAFVVPVGVTEVDVLLVVSDWVSAGWLGAAPSF